MGKSEKITETIYVKCLIYCRVSSPKQKKEGHGLESQEHRCRQYALQNGYEVERVFLDDYTGGGDFMKRPQMAALLDYLDSHLQTPYVVIFDDLRRFARDVKFHWQLRGALDARQAKPACLNFNFEDSPVGRFVETISAAQGQLEREQNRIQVMQKQKARLELGYWTFCHPAGMHYINDPIHGRILDPLEPFASIYKKAIEGYSSYRFNTLNEVKEFVLSQYEEHDIKRKLSLSGTHRILTNILYTGYIQYGPWSVSLRKGHHKGFITMDTYRRVQEKLEKSSWSSKRKDNNESFPLRSYVVCPGCGKPQTGSWNKGRSKSYPYYWCKSAKCKYRWKGIKKEVIEKDFAELLKTLIPNSDILDMVQGIVGDVWSERRQQESVHRSKLNGQINKLDEQIAVYVERLGQILPQNLIEQYQNKVEQLQQKKNQFETECSKLKYSDNMFGTALKAVMKVVKNPVKLWESPLYEDKRLLLGMYFEERISYDRETGFGTATLPHILELCKQKSRAKNNLVTPCEIL